MTSIKSLCSTSAIALLALAVSPMATAQEEESRLDTVTVSAQRLEESLQDVPLSVSQVSGERLDVISSGGADIRFLSARVPSVIAESSFGRAFPRFYIRGIGNTDFDLNASQPVSLVYDDVPYENPILKGYPVFDIEDIEVLRGPQGTLFGRNTPGGIIKFDSVAPTDEFHAYLDVTYGSYNTAEIEGAVGGRVHEALAVRLSGLYQYRDDYVDNAFTGYDDVYEGFQEYAVRGQALFTPFDNDFEALFNVHARSNRSSARLFRANIIDPGTNGVGSNFDRDTVYFDGQNGLSQNAWGSTITLTKSLSDAIDATYIFSFETADVESVGDIDGGFGAAFLGAGNFGPGFIPFPSESGGRVNNIDQYTNELRLAYDNGGRLTGQAGFFLFDETVDITSTSFDTLAPGNPLNGEAVRTGDTESSALFASLTYDLTERLSVQAGARYTQEDKTFSVARTLGPFGAPPLGPIDGATGDDFISWDLTAMYDLNEDTNVYGRVARGFRGPSIQGRLVFGDLVSIADTESVISYEAGVKSDILPNVRGSASVFYYTLEDQQLTIVGGLNNTVALFNADEGRGYGFEAEVEAAPIENLLLTGGLSYNNTEILDDVLIAPGCGAPCTVLDPEVYDSNNNFLGYNISGNPFPNSPEWIANFTARYAIPFREGEFFAYTDWAYKGDTNFFLYESVEFSEDGYWEGGLRAGYASDAGWEASVFARNITDVEVLEGAIDFNNLTGFVNEPRIVGVSFSIHN
ncbi:TonB-dependent receptor [Ponticaulis sp.]|uniref:TonB-dependent receptor n=1 Tax=Ponticaulis sp. TaxID=2020902 RepID=UPI000B62888E|nr:TonB-dependent receptor [Ponticaulis sp.]MAJ08038.1 TonB-dependent receptor [Ponticaulis sp.]RPG18344.1 MAG: TonB-dependent receptor [Hyphomonadaceae bacterium TMED125]